MVKSSDGGSELEHLIDVCRFLPNFLDKGTWKPATDLEDVVLRTLARGRGTYTTILDLVERGQSLQAAMLGRSLFEDMVVAHWLVLHDADPDWLIRRFNDHQDAMRLYDATIRQEVNFLPSGDDVSDLAGREHELRAEFGKYAERDWWGRDSEGRRVKMPALVARLAASRRFQPRLKGEQPILEQYYAVQHKAWTQALHHTAAGMHVRSDKDGRFPVAISPNSFLVLFGNYWVFGQLIFVALELAGSQPTFDYFEKLFLAGLAVFGEATGVSVAWADKVAEWADEVSDTG
jgi:Family of unknown function (DUF5677)